MRLPYQRAKVQQCRTGLALVAQNMPRQTAGQGGEASEHRTEQDDLPAGLTTASTGLRTRSRPVTVAAPLPLELGSAELHPG
jgi:hypothetical protein